MAVISLTNHQRGVMVEFLESLTREAAALSLRTEGDESRFHSAVAMRSKALVACLRESTASAIVLSEGDLALARGVLGQVRLDVSRRLSHVAKGSVVHSALGAELDLMEAVGTILE